MDMEVTFPGGARVAARFGPFTVQTDQPPQGGGEGAWPSPFSYFLASLATCAGYYVLSFCRQRGLPSEGIRLVQRSHTDPASGMVEKVQIEIQLPDGFPEKYREAVIRSAELCAVKKHIESPPAFEINTRSALPGG